MRLRVFLIVVGALLVIATFTFPVWQPYVQNTTTTTTGDGGTIVFPGLPSRYQNAFAVLPPDQQAAYRALAAINQDVAVRMATGALQPGAPAQSGDAELPDDLNSPELTATGVFQQLDPIRFAQGTADIYTGADDRKVLRFENFTVINNSDLRVILSASPNPTTQLEMRMDNIEFDVGVLEGTFGAQNYELPVELDLSSYASVVIYSPSVDMIYSIAPLFFY